MLYLDRQDTLEALAAFEQQLGDERHSDSVMSHYSTVSLDETSSFPSDAVNACINAGFFQFFIPTELGGKLSSFDQVIMQARAISRRDLTSAIAIGQTFLGALPVLLYGTSDQKSNLVEKLGRGALGCLALTEKDNGSDILSTAFVGRIEGDSVYLSGEKWLINNATRGESVTLLCRFNEAGRQRLGCVYIDKASPSFSHCENIEKIKTHGIRGADISGIRFNNSPIPLSAMLPSRGPDIFTVLKTLQISRVLCASFSLGAHDNALRTTLSFAVSRVLYRKPMTEIPNVSRLLSEAYCQLLANENLSLVVARCIRHYPEQLALYSALVKYVVPLTAEQSMTRLKTVLGARYYLREEHCHGMFQKNYRDNEVVSLFDGSSQVNLSIIASQLVALTVYLRKGDWVEREGIRQLFVDKAVLNNDSCLNADLMAVSNNGRDYMLESFLALITTERLQNSHLGDEFGNCVTQIHRELEVLVGNIEMAASQGNKDPNSAAFFDFADQYTHLMLAVCYVLQIYYQGPREQHLAQSDLAVLRYLCSNLGLAVNVEYSAAIQRMLQQFEQRQLFSQYLVSLGGGASQVG